MASSSLPRTEAGEPRWFSMSELRQVDETLWEIPAEARPDMRVPARIFADAELLEAIRRDTSLEQLQNVATLPGVVSPGGVGYDINCGVRLLAAPLTADELGARKEPLVHEISRAVPAGAGKE